MTRDDPSLPLSELAGFPVPEDDEGELSPPLSAEEVAELEGWFEGEGGRLEADLKVTREALKARIRSETTRAEELVTPRRLVRLNSRFVLYATQLAAAVVLALTYLGAIASVLTLRHRERVLTTQNELRAIAVGAKAYSRERGTLSAASLEALIAELVSARGERDYLPINAEDRAARLRGGVLLDVWEQPYVCQRDGTRLVLYSIGPNGRDDGGDGDDIRLVERLD